MSSGDPRRLAALDACARVHQRGLSGGVPGGQAVVRTALPGVPELSCADGA